MTKSWSTKTYWENRFDVGDTPWELGQASTVVCEALQELGNMGVVVRGSAALSPGCGTGSDVMELVRRGAHVTAIDWASSAVTRVRTRYESEKTPQCGSLTVIEGDFFSVPVRSMNLVVEHTFFCAIDPSTRPKYVERLSRWIKPGGFLLGNFFIVTDEVARTLPGLSLTQAGEGPPFAATVSEVESLLSPYFVKRVLREAHRPAPERRPGVEWVGIFERRP